MKICCFVPIAVASVMAGCSTVPQPDPAVRITVDPHCTRQIGGQSVLERDRYFCLSDPGRSFDERCKDDEMYKYLVHELGIRFGRDLGPVRAAVTWSQAVEEDPNRPGYANAPLLAQKLGKSVKAPSEKMRRDFGSNLGVAAHGNHNAYPEFMGKHGQPEALKGPHAETLPENIDAAVELAVNVFKHGYTDFDRPAFFEPLNEPHWAYFGDPHLADWHLTLQEAFHREVPGTRVGGLCLSVAYLYDHDYRTWNGFRKFIDNTEGQLDFYSFHAYDYLDFVDNEFIGRVQGGLPMEGVLDLIPNYTVNQYGREVPVAISEQGGYITGKQGRSGDEIATAIATEKFPGEGFEWEMKRRSILAFNHVSSIVANTLNFMDHPHIVQKAVPFILLESFAWDPKYYSTLYTMYDYEDPSRWMPSRNMDFYAFFRDLNGRRVRAHCADPDIQARAFVDGSRLHVVLNNLWTEPQDLSLELPRAKTFRIRRLGRNQDFTPYLRESEVTSLKGLTLAGRESMLVSADMGSPIAEQRVINEVACYGDQTVVRVAAGEQASFKVHVPDGDLDYAVLRVGFRRPAETPRLIAIEFNGNPVPMPPEDSAARFENDSDYATTRMALVNPDWVKEENVITVSFPDGEVGTVGTVVLRVAEKQES